MKLDKVKQYTIIFKEKLKIIIYYLKGWKHSFSENNIPVKAAALSYSTVLAIVPFLTLLFAIFTSFHAFDQLKGQLETFVFTNLIPNANQELIFNIKKFISSAKELSLFGTVVIVVVSTDLFIKLNRTISGIWKIKNKRNIFQTITIFWMTVTVGPILLALTFFLNKQMGAALGGSGLVSFGVNIFVFIMFYFFHLVLPNTKVKKTAAVAGAMFAVIFLAILKYLFSIFFASVSTWKTIYGPLSVLPMLFVWVYFNWQVILISVQLTFYLTRGHYMADVFMDSKRDYLAIHMIALLYDSYREGNVGLSYDKLQHSLKVSNRVLNEIIFKLINEKILLKEQSRYILIIPPAKIKVFDILKLFSFRPKSLYDNFSSNEKIIKYFIKLDKQIVTLTNNDFVDKLI